MCLTNCAFFGHFCAKDVKFSAPMLPLNFKLYQNLSIWVEKLGGGVGGGGGSSGFKGLAHGAQSEE